MGGPGSGRKPKSAREHILQGTFCGTRHAPADLASVDDLGELKRPDGLDASGRWMFRIINEGLRGRGVLTSLDAPLVRSICEVWSLYRAAFRVAKKDPTDPHARTAVVAYWEKWHSMACRLGLNPVDRAKIKTRVPESPKVATRKRA